MKIRVKEVGFNGIFSGELGYNDTKQYKVGGCDLGFPLYDSVNDKLYLLFGDTFQENNFKYDWRSNSMFLVKELDKSGRIIVDHFLNNLETRLLDGLRLLDVYYHRNGDNNHLFGNISLSFPFQDGEALLHRMDLLGISVSTGSACNGESTQISHVLKAIGLDETLANGTIRISLGKENTLEDVDFIISTIKKIITI